MDFEIMRNISNTKEIKVRDSAIHGFFIWKYFQTPASRQTLRIGDDGQPLVVVRKNFACSSLSSGIISMFAFVEISIISLYSSTVMRLLKANDGRTELLLKTDGDGDMGSDLIQGMLSVSFGASTTSMSLRLSGSFNSRSNAIKSSITRKATVLLERQWLKSSNTTLSVVTRKEVSWFEYIRSYQLTEIYSWQIPRAAPYTHRTEVASSHFLSWINIEYIRVLLPKEEPPTLAGSCDGSRLRCPPCWGLIQDNDSLIILASRACTSLGWIKAYLSFI